MASTAFSLAQSPSTPNSTSFRRVCNSISGNPKHVAAPRSSSRRDFLLLLTATTSLQSAPAFAKDIPLFGIRKRLEQTEELVKEGFEAAEKGVEAAEKSIEAVAIEAEKEIETTAIRIGAPAQAGVVAGAELLGVVVASSVVNAILGPDPQN